MSADSPTVVSSEGEPGLVSTAQPAASDMAKVRPSAKRFIERRSWLVFTILFPSWQCALMWSVVRSRGLK